jgi:hypothetical protein
MLTNAFSQLCHSSSLPPSQLRITPILSTFEGLILWALRRSGRDSQQICCVRQHQVCAVAGLSKVLPTRERENTYASLFPRNIVPRLRCYTEVS